MLPGRRDSWVSHSMVHPLTRSGGSGFEIAGRKGATLLLFNNPRAD